MQSTCEEFSLLANYLQRVLAKGKGLSFTNKPLDKNINKDLQQKNQSVIFTHLLTN